MSAVRPETAESLRALIVAPVDAERARLREAIADLKEEIAAADTKDAVQRARWEEKDAEARAAFRAAPPVPTPRDTTQQIRALHLATARLGECQTWEFRLLGENKPRIEAAYRHALSDLVERTRQTPLGDVEQILPEWNDWLRLVRDARSAAERAGGAVPHNPVRERMRSTITASDLFDALKADVDLLAVIGIPSSTARPATLSPVTPMGSKRCPVSRHWINGEPSSTAVRWAVGAFDDK